MKRKRGQSDSKGSLRAPHVGTADPAMPKEWLAQPVFVEVLKSMRVVSRDKLLTLEALAVEDARFWYKHASAILVKQVQSRQPRHRVPVLYVINTLVTHETDLETKQLYQTRFAPEIVTCIDAALKCPPEHVTGVRRVLNRWRRLKTFEDAILNKAAALVKAYKGGEPGASAGVAGSRDSSVVAEEGEGDASPNEDDEGDDEEEYVLSEDDDEAVSAQPATTRATGETTALRPQPQHTAPVPFKPSLDFAKSRVNKWPSKPKPQPSGDAVVVDVTEKRNATSASQSANPPPPAANPLPPQQQDPSRVERNDRDRNVRDVERNVRDVERNDDKIGGFANREDRGREDRRSDDRRRSDKRKYGGDDDDDDDGGNRPRSGRDRDRDRGRLDGRRDETHRDRNGSGNRAPVLDKWGDPIRENDPNPARGGDERNKEKNRNRDARDRNVRSPVRLRSPPRRRSDSPEKVRSPVR